MKDSLSVFLLWISGATLRMTVVAILPLLVVTQNELGMSGTQVAILTTLPVILMAVASPPGSLLIARVGPLNALLIGFLTTALGGGLRAFAFNVWALYGATAVMSLGVTLIQTSLPPLVRQWLPDRATFGSAVYNNGFLIAAMLPIGFTMMLIPFLWDSWRIALAFWSLPTLLIALIVYLLAPKDIAVPAPSVRLPWLPDWRDATMWKIGVIFGSCNLMYYGVNSFMPASLVHVGREDLVVLALTVLNAACVPASFVLMAAARYTEGRAWPLALSCGLSLASIGGIVTTASLWTVIFAGLLGFGVTCTMILVLSLPLVLAAPRDIARLTAGIFVTAYVLGVSMSVISGAVWDLTGDPRFAFLPVVLGALPALVIPFRLVFGRPA
ncbi:MAG: CynX/NimT family MFS transporter [Pseudorhodoplanes sp.]